ncbi:MAG: 50S ribosomal protein L13 [Anaerolineales bacterium]|nr:50S ribosomal protein L13 [Anaerolineales bacterium]MCX7608865.1 50S ribosomal protein L13 [Anaerolineales bacterium]
MYKSYYPKASEIERQWLLVDAEGQNLGRLASKIASLLLGKHKPSFTPGVPMGDYVVVINAEKITVTGTKTSSKMTTKMYYRHSGYPGGLKSVSLRRQLETHPDRVIRAAVWGMLPHNRMGRHLLKNLKIYAGSHHPHAAQKPQPV